MWMIFAIGYFDRRLFQERLNQVKMKLDEVLTGKAREYRDPLATLQQNLQQRTQVAGNTMRFSCFACDSYCSQSVFLVSVYITVSRFTS